MPVCLSDFEAVIIWGYLNFFLALDHNSAFWLHYWKEDLWEMLLEGGPNGTPVDIKRLDRLGWNRSWGYEAEESDMIATYLEDAAYRWGENLDIYL